MSELNDKNKTDKQKKKDHLEINLKPRRLHKRKSNPTVHSKVIEGIITKITETSISDSKTLSASDTEEAFLLPAARRHRRRKTKTMETEINQNFNSLVIDSSKIKTPIKVKKESFEDSSLSEDDESGREGDDEMTDYHSGPETKGPVYWFDRPKDEDDETFNTILRGALPLLTEVPKPITAKQTGFRHRLERLTSTGTDARFRSFRNSRRGKRRNKQINKSLKGVSMQQTDQSATELEINRERCCSKRRKVDLYEEIKIDDEIPPTNVGYQMLSRMGWLPGSDINRTLIPKPRKKRSGLGF